LKNGSPGVAGTGVAAWTGDGFEWRGNPMTLEASQSENELPGLIP
jgi:hypothetical protein